MATSCCQWRHAPLYFAASIVLAIFAISTALHSISIHQKTPRITSGHLILNASRSLRRSGFHITATLLQISPDLFLPPSSSASSNSTIFAIKDSAIFNASSALPPWLFNQLIQYHILPNKSSFQDLLQLPPSSCLPTLLPGKNLAISKVDANARRIEINNVSLSFPDLFLGGPISIQGILEPFSAFDRREVREGWASIRSACDSNQGTIAIPNSKPPSSASSTIKDVVMWGQIVRLLSSKGYVPFAIGLHSVLGGILREFKHLGAATIFAPPNLGIVGSSSPLLGRIVRFHIVPERLSYAGLAAAALEKKGLRTLLRDRGLEIARSKRNLKKLAVNGVEITAPDVLSSEKFVVHGIARALEMAELPNTS